jgi:hypothetical protein
MGVFGYLRAFLLSYTNIVMSDDSARELAFIISPFIIAPVLVFSAYTYVFNYPRTKNTLKIILSTILILFAYSCYFVLIKNPIDEISMFLNPYTIWQAIMALALQLIHYQIELKALFKPKTNK